jgi:hypothetical protein
MSANAGDEKQQRQALMVTFPLHTVAGATTCNQGICDKPQSNRDKCVVQISIMKQAAEGSRVQAQFKPIKAVLLHMKPQPDPRL